MDQTHGYEIGRKGRITAGDDRYRYVQVQEDTEKGGGYSILLWVDEGVNNTYDDWVMNEAELDGYFEEKDWTIDWL